MKQLLLAFSLFLSLNSFAQNLNYCDYFELHVKYIEYKGEMHKSYRPTCLENKKDNFGKFLKKHHNRFDYILNKNLNNIMDLVNYYPDTFRIKNEYCAKYINTLETQQYFQILTPKAISAFKIPADTYSVSELMLVASKFFYCDKIIEKDTAIQSHICIGINGQKEFKSNRDLTVLEAFCFEAIFSYLVKRKDPLFYKEYSNYLGKVRKEKKSDFKDFDSYLLDVRKLIYNKMQHSKALEAALLKYYHQNKNNLNFIIK